VFLSRKRDLQAAIAFFATATRFHGDPAEATTDRAHSLVRAIVELLPAALHVTTQYANNRVEADHGRLKARLRPMRGLKRDRTASVVLRGHAFIQDLRQRHYELRADTRPGLTLAAAFDDSRKWSDPRIPPELAGLRPTINQCNRALSDNAIRTI